MAFGSGGWLGLRPLHLARLGVREKLKYADIPDGFAAGLGYYVYQARGLIRVWALMCVFRRYSL